MKNAASNKTTARELIRTTKRNQSQSEIASTLSADLPSQQAAGATEVSRRGFLHFAAGAGAISIAAISACSQGGRTGGSAGPFDLAITGGRVMDPETKFDRVANVGIKDGKIAAISEQTIQGAETIDAAGHVVAPGFIDTHWHYSRPWSNKLALRDGRTTVLDLEIGTHGPYVNQWYAEREGNSQVNYGQAVAHEFARSEVLDGFQGAQDVPSAIRSRGFGEGWCCRRPTLDEGNRILQLLDQGLAAGGLGIGSTLDYMRDGVSARELFELQKLAGRYGRQVGAHFRYTPGTDTTEANGIQELLSNAAALGAPALACHFNNPGYNVVHELLVRMRDDSRLPTRNSREALSKKRRTT